MTWFLTRSKEDFISRREVPLSDYELANLPDESQPDNIWQSLLQAPPGHMFKIPKNQPDIVKEALLDCMDMLVEQDKYVIDAIIYEQIGYPSLAKRLRLQHTARMETDPCCI